MNKKFRVKVEAEYIIEAVDEEEAREMFFADIVEGNQMGRLPQGFISRSITNLSVLVRIPIFVKSLQKYSATWSAVMLSFCHCLISGNFLPFLIGTTFQPRLINFFATFLVYSNSVVISYSFK